MCYKAEENIKCIVPGCTTLAPSEYTKRHNKVAGYIHWTICNHMGFTGYWQVLWTYTWKDHTVWDVPVITDQTILANWPDVVLHYKKESTCLLINIAIPDDSNINTKETENLSKYTDLEIEVSRMWKVKMKTVPVIIAALGTIKKGLDQKLQLLPGHPLAKELQ